MEELSHFDKEPQIQPAAFVAPSSELMGDVTLGQDSSVFYQAVLRGDINAIRIGDRSNIQDGCIIHVSSDLPAIVGDLVTVGHRAIIHACQIGDGCLVGMASTIMDGATVGPRCLIAAGAVVLPNTNIPEGSLVAGCPATVRRKLAVEEQEDLVRLAHKYVKVATAHSARLGQHHP